MRETILACSSVKNTRGFDEENITLKENGIITIERTIDGITEKIERNLKPVFHIEEVVFSKDKKMRKKDVSSNSETVYLFPNADMEEAYKKLSECREKNDSPCSDFRLVWGIFSYENKEWMKEVDVYDFFLSFGGDPIPVNIRVKQDDEGMLELVK